MIKKILKKENKYITYFKRFWNYLWHDDSFGSYILSLFVAFILIKFLLFPTLGFVLNNDFPIVAIVSGSMEHKIVNHQICDKSVLDISSKSLNHDEWWSFCGNYYEKNYNLSQDDFKEFEYKNGLNIGDVMVLYGKKPSNIDVGEVIVFIPQDKMVNGESMFFTNYGPVIHRVTKKFEENGTLYFQTKGDHNPLSKDRFEQKIPANDVIGVSVIRIPYIGYVKLALNNILIKLGIIGHH